jgi:hypothetical protein
MYEENLTVYQLLKKTRMCLSVWWGQGCAKFPRKINKMPQSSLTKSQQHLSSFLTKKHYALCKNMQEICCFRPWFVKSRQLRERHIEEALFLCFVTYDCQRKFRTVKKHEQYEDILNSRRLMFKTFLFHKESEEDL